MNPFAYRRRILASSIAALISAAHPILAATGTWTNATGGSWLTAGNWSGGVIPTVTGDIADFSELALASSPTITLDANETVGTLLFGDTGSTYNWTLANGTGGPWTLTLAASSGAPVINVVNDQATISAVLAGTTGFSKTGTGNLVLPAANTYTGTTSVNAGTLTLDFSQSGAPATNIINSSSPLALAGGTLNVIGKASTTNSQTFAGLTLNAGASSITASANATSNPLLIALGDITTNRNIGSTLTLTQPTGTISATNGFTTTSSNAYGATTNAILGGWITVGTTDFATNNGTNIVAATSTNSGTTTTASFYSGINVNFNNNITLAGAITPNSIRFSNTANRTETLTGTNVIASGGILINSVSTNVATLTGGTLTSGNGKDLIVTHYGTNTFTIASVIADNGTPIGLTKSGSGNLVLQGINTYTGATTVNAGTLTLNTNAGVIGTSTITINGGSLTLGIANAIGSSSTVSINGGTLAVATFADTVAGVSLKSGSITGTTGTLTSTTAFDLQSGTVAPVLAGSAGAVKTTTGTVTISKAATFTGGTQIKAGTIKLGVANAIASQALTLGDATANTAGTLDLAGFAETISKLTSAGKGSSLVTNSSTTPATLSITGTSGTFTGVIQDGAVAGGTSVSFTSGGSATFTGANTYTGQTLVQNFTLTLTGGDNRLSTSDAVQLNNGGKLILGDTTGASNQTVTSLTIGTAASLLNRVSGGNATQTSTLTINNATAVSFSGTVVQAAASSAAARRIPRQ